jgi:hypothetical protein
LPISAILAISSAALCLRPSARPPPPIALLVKTKSEVPFDSTVERAVEAIFLVFQWSNRDQLHFFFVGRWCRSAEGRGLFSFTQLPITHLPNSL